MGRIVVALASIAFSRAVQSAVAGGCFPPLFSTEEKDKLK